MTDLQSRVGQWVQACLGDEVACDLLERQDRFLEEVFELLQAGGYPPERIDMLKNYTFNRPVGEVDNEFGGVGTTLMALGNAHKVDVLALTERELGRCWERIDRIREKHKSKPRGPLPGV